MPRLLRLSVALFLIAGGLAACGKRGHLEPPPSQKTEAEAAPATGTAANPGETKLGAKKRVPITPPKRDLLIDRLLD